jgi:ribosomal-protein-alanine N-acetyltransferase
LITRFFDNLINQENLLIKLQAIDQEFFPEPWSQHQWNETKNGKYLIGTGSIDEQIVAFALFLHSPHERLVHLVKIITVPKMRKNHFAIQLFTNIIGNLLELKVERCYLEVNCENIPAINLYQSLGFKQLNRIPRFYSNGCDAFTMELHLPLNN